MKRLPSLNGLRGISILMVVFSHLVYNNHLDIYDFDLRWINLMFRPLYDGQLGVNIFFVISGFLITKILIQENETEGRISIRKFYTKRILRIFPAYYFLLFSYFILQSLNLIYIDPKAWLTAITYTEYFNHDLDILTGHAWTLSVEEHFYLLWPLAFTRSKKFQKKLAIFIIILVPLIRVFDHFYQISFIHHYSIFYRLDAIAFGCLVALYLKEIIELVQPYWKYIFPVSLIMLVTFRIGVVALDRIGLGFLWIPFGKTSGTLANLLISLILLYSVYGPQKSWFKFLNSNILTNVGIYSYSIYLWQQFFLSNKYDYWFVKFPQNLVFLFMLSIISFNLIEKPFLKLKSRFN
ncbi:acyltransferase family protein [Ekhidna sp. To15]|uniref:acyltransferase family protein n=1 Tax=Ekhidna sp. To15 TaxID=3395267 RepID=UPI003F528DBF